MNPSNNSINNIDLLSTFVGKEVAQALMQHFGSLHALARASVDELRAFQGIGEARALTIKSAFALAARLSRESWAQQPLLDTPERIADLLREDCRLYETERFHVVLLNTRRRLITVEQIASGTLDSVLVSPSIVFKQAIVKAASALVLCHNHCSGNPEPSQADIKITRDLIRAGKLIKIEVLDHIILGGKTADRERDFVSLRELGYCAV